ncbi:MAG: AraC family transcriptional regulator [Allomuricauda sp.]
MLSTVTIHDSLIHIDMMMFNEKHFLELNSKRNVAIKSSVDKFESVVNSSGLSIKVPIDGNEHYSLGNQYHKVKPGQFLVVNQGEPIRCTLDSDKAIESICIYLDMEMYLEILETVQTQEKGRFQRRYYNEVVSDKYYLDNCGLSTILKRIKAYSDPKRLNEEDFILLTEQLVAHQEHQKQLLANINALNPATRMELLRRLRKAKSFIFENFKTDISLEQIAKESCLSKYHLLRSFKDVYGLTPYQALLKRRIDMGAQYLNHGYSVQDAAIKSGFGDRRSFSRVFKNMNGTSPTNFVKDLV